MIEGMNALDRALFLFLNKLHTPALDPVMVLVSGQAIWIPFIGFFLWYSYKHFGGRSTGLFLLFLLLAIIASDVNSSYILKNLTERLRPCRLSELKPLIYSFGQKCGGRYGFVSSHAANSMCLVFFSLRALGLKGFYNFLWIIPVMVAYSRIYLGVHYPGDVLGGTVVGLFWAYVFSSLYLQTYGAKRKISQPEVLRS